MNLYRISQDENTGYDAYDSGVVAAKSREDAATIHPGGDGKRVVPPTPACAQNGYCDCGRWCVDGDWTNDVSKVTVKEIGVASKGIEVGVIVASYNAG